MENHFTRQKRRADQDQPPSASNPSNVGSKVYQVLPGFIVAEDGSSLWVPDKVAFLNHYPQFYHSTVASIKAVAKEHEDAEGERTASFQKKQVKPCPQSCLMGMKFKSCTNCGGSFKEAGKSCTSCSGVKMVDETCPGCSTEDPAADVLNRGR